MNGSNELVNPTNNIQLYYRSQMAQQYKQEEKNLRNIDNNFISPVTIEALPLLSTTILRAPNLDKRQNHQKQPPPKHKQ